MRYLRAQECVESFLRKLIQLASSERVANCLGKSRRSVAARACWKLFEKVKSVAVRASPKLREKNKDVLKACMKLLGAVKSLEEKR